MDINELLEREQVSLANAAGARCDASRFAHAGLARAYGARLRDAGYSYPPEALTATL